MVGVSLVRGLVGNFGERWRVVIEVQARSFGMKGGRRARGSGGNRGHRRHFEREVGRRGGGGTRRAWYAGYGG